MASPYAFLALIDGYTLSCERESENRAIGSKIKRFGTELIEERLVDDGLLAIQRRKNLSLR